MLSALVSHYTVNGGVRYSSRKAAAPNGRRRMKRSAILTRRSCQVHTTRSLARGASRATPISSQRLSAVMTKQFRNVSRETSESVLDRRSLFDNDVSSGARDERIFRSTLSAGSVRGQSKGGRGQDDDGDQSRRGIGGTRGPSSYCRPRPAGQRHDRSRRQRTYVGAIDL